MTPKAWAQDGAGRCRRSCTTFFQLELTGLLRVKFKSGDVLQVVS